MMRTAAAASLGDRLRTQLADFKMPGALEALDDILAGLDGGTMQARRPSKHCSAPRSRCATIAACKRRCAPHACPW